MEYYQEQIRLLVWSGFADEAALSFHLEDLEYEEDARPLIGELREFGIAEMECKKTAEAGWPERTDCDRLDEVFRQLQDAGILALHNAGYTTSDAHDDAWQIIRDSPEGQWKGFCYYHGQDVERSVQAMPLFIGFDAVEKGTEAKRTTGESVANKLRDAGFAVDWNGDPEMRMSITNLDWKRRTQWASAAGSRLPPANKPGLIARLFRKKA